jgi:hypothetical protein
MKLETTGTAKSFGPGVQQRISNTRFGTTRYSDLVFDDFPRVLVLYCTVRDLKVNTTLPVSQFCQLGQKLRKSATSL